MEEDYYQYVRTTWEDIRRLSGENEALRAENERLKAQGDQIQALLHVLDHSTLNALFGLIEDSTTREAERYWGYVKQWMELRSHVMLLVEPST